MEKLTISTQEEVGTQQQIPQTQNKLVIQSENDLDIKRFGHTFTLSKLKYLNNSSKRPSCSFIWRSQNNK